MTKLFMLVLYTLDFTGHWTAHPMRTFTTLAECQRWEHLYHAPNGAKYECLSSSVPAWQPAD